MQRCKIQNSCLDFRFGNQPPGLCFFPKRHKERELEDLYISINMFLKKGNQVKALTVFFACPGISPRRRNPEEKKEKKSRGGVLAHQRKSRFAWLGTAWNLWVMITFLLITHASKRCLGWRRTKKPRRNLLGWFCDSYCTVILWYSFALRAVISDILWSSCFESYGPKDSR